MNEIRLCLGSLSLSSVQILSPSKIQKLYKSFIFLHFSLAENYNNTISNPARELIFLLIKYPEYLQYTLKLRVFLNINFVVWKVIDFSVVFVPLAQEADHGVEEEQEEEDQDEDLLGPDLYRGVWRSRRGLIGCNVGEIITARGTN